MKDKIIKYFENITDEQLQEDLKKANYDLYKTINVNILDPGADYDILASENERLREALREIGAGCNSKCKDCTVFIDICDAIKIARKAMEGANAENKA